MIPSPEPERLERDVHLLRAFLVGRPVACRQVEGWARQIASFPPYRIPPDARDDVVQETLAALLRVCGRKDFELRFGARALVQRIAVARCIDWRRRQRPLAELDESFADPSPPPDEAASRESEKRLLRRAVQQLDARCRELVRQHFLEGVSYRDLAARLELAEATIRVHMFNCMKKLRRALWGEPPEVPGRPSPA